MKEPGMKKLDCTTIIMGIDIEEGEEDYPYELCDENTNVAGRVYCSGKVIGSYRLVFVKIHVTDNWFDGIKYGKQELCYQYALTWYSADGKGKPVFSYINALVSKVENKRRSTANIPEEFFLREHKYDDITVDTNGDIIIIPALPAESITLNIVLTYDNDYEKNKLVKAYDEAMKLLPGF